MHLISLAALFLLLRAEFVAAAQVVVYAGAVMVLYVFVVAYVGGSDEPLAPRAGGALRVLGPLFALALAIELCIAMLGSALKGISGHGAPYVPGFGTPRQIGTPVPDHLPVPVRDRLAAADGRRDRRGRAGPPPARPGATTTSIERIAATPRPLFTGTMAEAAGTASGRRHRRGRDEDQSDRDPASVEPTASEGGW